MKGIARASKRGYRAFRYTFQPVVAVAKHAGEWTARMEVIASSRVLRYRCLFLLDGLTQATYVETQFCR